MAELSSNSKGGCYDPAFLNARREALVILIVWIAGLAWTVGYCLVTGYEVPPEQLKAAFGMPHWVFWGVLVPWVVIVLFSIWFGLFYIAPDQLGQEQDQSGQDHLTTGSKPETDDVSQ